MLVAVQSVRKVFQFVDSFLEDVENAFPRCENCGKRVSPWQRICSWCGYERW